MYTFLPTLSSFYLDYYENESDCSAADSNSICSQFDELENDETSFELPSVYLDTTKPVTKINNLLSDDA